MFVREDLLATKYSVDMELANTFVNYHKDTIGANVKNNNNHEDGETGQKSLKRAITEKEEL